MFPLSDNFEKDKTKKIDDFLSEFDKISEDFEKGSIAFNKQDNLTDKVSNTEQSTVKTPKISNNRMDRLHKSITSKEENIELTDTVKSIAGDIMNTKNTKNKKHRFNIKRLLLTILCVVVVIFGGMGIWAITVIASTPVIDADNLYSMLSENSTIFDDEGNEIENLFTKGAGLRTNLNYTDMPENLIDAFVAIEDKTFWEHKGFNFIRIFGAIIDGITSGDSIRGTSTITQQLARNLYLEDTKSLRSLERKVKEAHYAIQLERQLTKEQIIEAYLNTIYLGSGANGVQAASQAYFSKDADELTLAECAVLASIPKSPSKYSPIKRLENEDISNPDSLDFIYRGDTYSVWYQDDYKDRQLLTLQFMKEQNYINEEEYEEAINEDIRLAIKPDTDNSSDISSYFADYVVEEVMQGLMDEFKLNEVEAKNMIYNGGLRIYTTLNVQMQKIAEKEFENNKNFPKVTGLKKDKSGNALDSKGNILLYHYSNMFDDQGNFNLKPDEYKLNKDGSMTIFKNHRLNFYKTQVQGNIDYSVEFKPTYLIEDRIFYCIPGGYISISPEYKKRNEDGDLILSKDFLEKHSNFIFSDNGVTIPIDCYQLKERVIQPQSAMVILDYKTGGIKAMVGGRSLSGKLLFNRATATRQPGSAIKPMAVYAPALQRSVDMVNDGTKNKTMWTAASMIEDAPYYVQGKLWPKNWYSGYRGFVSLRQSVEQSINVNAVKVFSDIGPNTSVAFLKKFGITSIVESGNTNDMNAAALALGGMTRGISPLQMSAGYGTFANQGKYTKPVAYTKVTNKKDELLLESNIRKEQILDKGIAFIMTDILRTTVTNGIAGAAAIGSQPVAGKTGTTSDNYDAWFVGMTPYYSAALWIGNDINLELSQGSVSAARLWSKIMKQVHSGLPKGSFPTADNVVSIAIDTKSGKLPSEFSLLDPRGTIRNEYFVKGTAPTEVDNSHVSVTICTDSGYLATPLCVHKQSKAIDGSFEVPRYYCNLHNPDSSTYPIDTNATKNENNENNEDNEPDKPIPDNQTNPSTEPKPNNNGNGNNSNKPEWLN